MHRSRCQKVLAMLLSWTQPPSHSLVSKWCCGLPSALLCACCGKLQAQSTWAWHLVLSTSSWLQAQVRHLTLGIDGNSKLFCSGSSISYMVIFLCCGAMTTVLAVFISFLCLKGSSSLRKVSCSTMLRVRRRVLKAINTSISTPR